MMIVILNIQLTNGLVNKCKKLQEERSFRNGKNLETERETFLMAYYKKKIDSVFWVSCSN